MADAQYPWMMVVTVLARVLGAGVSLYMMLCTVRVFMSWAPGSSLGKAGDLVRKAVDPYLGYFTRFRFLRTSRMDFSPIAALAVLSVLNNIFGTLAYAGRISLGLVLALILGAFWSAVGFVLSFLAFCAAARIAVYLFKLNSLSPLVMMLDSLINPALHSINRTIYRGKIVQYLQGLVTGFIVLTLARIAGGAVIGLASSLLQSLPL